MQQHGVRQLVPDPPDIAEVRLEPFKLGAGTSAWRVVLTHIPVRRDRSATKLVVTNLQENIQPVYRA